MVIGNCLRTNVEVLIGLVDYVLNQLYIDKARTRETVDELKTLKEKLNRRLKVNLLFPFESKGQKRAKKRALEDGDSAAFLSIFRLQVFSAPKQSPHPPMRPFFAESVRA